MLLRQGFTLMEMIVVLIIIAVVAVFSFPNFITPTEQARALTAQNNLLAIYSAEKNYYNNYGNFAQGASLTSTVEAIDSLLSLNILDDGTYAYDCGVTTTNYCTATRQNATNTPVIQVLLTQPINLNGETNPTCTCPSNPNWCP